MKTIIALLSSVALLAGAALATQEKEKPKGEKAQASVIAQQLPSYPLTTCPASGEPLDAMGEPINVVHEGRLIRLCCKSCTKAVKKDPAKVIAKIDEAVIKAQKASYPMETCPVSGEKLGGMGDPIDYVHGTRLVRFCCKGCVKGFKKDPAKGMQPVNAAYIAAQRESYPLTTCPLSGMEIEGEGEEILYGTRLVRFCCPKCKAAFEKDPAKTIAKLDAAMKESMKMKKEKKGI